MKKSIFFKLSTFLMAFAVLASCGKDDNKDKDKGKDKPDPTFESAITVDGNYADWLELDANDVTVFVSENTSVKNSAGKVLKVYMDEEFLSFYVEFDGTTPQAHFQVYIDEDNNGETGTTGLDYMFTNSGIEAMLEGSISGDTGYVAYDAGIFFPDLEIEDTWQWNDSPDIAAGAGVISSSAPKLVSGTTYAFEFQVSKSMLELNWKNTIGVGVGFMDAGWSRTGLLPVDAEGSAVDMLAVKLVVTQE